MDLQLLFIPGIHSICQPDGGTIYNMKPKGTPFPYGHWQISLVKKEKEQETYLSRVILRIPCVRYSRVSGSIIKAKLPGSVQTGRCGSARSYRGVLRPYNNFPTNSFIASAGSAVFMKFSPTKNPWKPASFNSLIVFGSDMPLSETLIKRSGIIFTKS